jgi:hypothetical protein
VNVNSKRNIFIIMIYKGMLCTLPLQLEHVRVPHCALWLPIHRHRLKSYGVNFPRVSLQPVSLRY